ncbi:MAG TPA: hypothetical protein VFU55_06650 [Terracidiphilus sp.]|nr:hypothetical protein [Terracidiphilus sp.]
MQRSATVSSSSTGFSIAAGRTAGAADAAGVKRRRIDREAGRALEMLSHAIEYLADEYAHDGGSLSGNDGAVEAIQLLMARNREVYFACPVVPTLWERIRGTLKRSESSR